MTKLLIALCLAGSTAWAQEAKVTPLLTHDLAKTDGQEGTLVMVEYAPGGSDAEHLHNAYAFVYVLEGALVMQVKGEEEVTVGPGQTFLSRHKTCTRFRGMPVRRALPDSWCSL